MKSMLGIAAIVALLALTGPAFAQERMTGRIATLDAQTGTVVLDNGETFTVREGTELKDLREGDEVTVSYEEHKGKNVADEILPTGMKGQGGSDQMQGATTGSSGAQSQ